MTAMDQNMGMANHAPNKGAIPQRLQEPLRIVAGRARLLAWFHALFKLAALVAVVWLVVVLLMGSSLQVPLWMALPLTVVGWGIVMVVAYRIFRELWRRKGGLASAALLADEALPESEERISSAVELAQEPDARFKGSPELIAVLLRQAEHHADTMDPATVISGRDVMRWLMAAVMALFIWFLLLVILTPNMLLGLQRLFQPWTAAAALPQPTMEVDPGDKILAQGADLPVKVVVHPPEGFSLEMGKVDKATIVQHFIGAQGGVSPDLATAMDVTLMTDTQAFGATFRSVQQSFTYKIVAEGDKNHMRAESPQYTVTVQTRPAVADVEVQYRYPTYTGLNGYSEHSREGAISALVGTKARVLIHATEPVKTAQITIEDEGLGGGAKTMDLVAEKPAEAPAGGAAGVGGPREAVYAGEITIRKNTSYQVKLVKEDGRDNPDVQARPIRALADNPPGVAILLPDPKAGALKVRPEDTVPMRYVATDDFGVERVEAVVSVDGGTEAILNVPLPGMQGRITGDFDLSLPYVLKTLTSTTGEPRSLTYYFRATDNREPTAQRGTSQKQTLTFDKSAPPLAQRMDTQAAQQLGAAIRAALNDLKDAQGKLDELAKNDTDKVLTAPNRQSVGDAQRNLTEAGRLLRQAADQADNSRLTDLSKQVRDIADQPVKAGEEEAVKAALASDQPQSRRDSEASAGKHTQEAIDRLTKLAEALHATAKDQPLAQKLEDMAQRQRQLAEALAKNPNDPALLQQQKDLQKELEQLIRDHPELQRPAADANQNRLNDLVRQVQQLEREQQPINDTVNNVNDAAGNGEKAADLAKRQAALNRDVKQFTNEHAETLRQAGAPQPDPGKMDPIVKELQDNKLNNAVRDQTAAAAALEQAARQLDAAQAKTTTPAKQAAAAQAEKDAQAAQALQEKAQQVAQDIEKAKQDGNPPTRPSDKANQAASNAANEAKQLAQHLQNRAGSSNDVKNSAQAAAKEADAAKAAASQGQAQQAQQHLAAAASQLAQAAQQEQAAAGGAPNGQAPDAAGKAPETAEDLAQKQRQLATDTAALAKAQQDAVNAKANADATANQQRDLASRIDQANKDAQDLQQQTQGPAPELAGKAGQAAQALHKAAQAQQEAAQATRGQDARTAAAQQNEAAEQLARAEEALTGQRRTASGKAQNQPNGRPNGQGQGADQANAGQQGNSGQQTNGQQASSPQGGAPQGSQQPDPGAVSQGNGQPGNAGQNQNGPQGGQSAAQAVQSARSSQSQASGGGNPGAAQQAAEQLAQASRQLMGNGNPNGTGGQPGANPGRNGTPGQNGMAGGPSNGAGQPGGDGRGGTTPGQGGTSTGSGMAGRQGVNPGSPGGTGSGMPGNGGGQGSGSDVTMVDGRPIEMPKEVQDVGIAPSDWIKLPLEMQDQLLHSAQQPGPPGYRDLIKNYYSRIARMQNQTGGNP
jgi:hypothetical protein